MQSYIDTLNMPLPEDILKRKWAGDLTGAVKAIDLRLQGELPEALRRRLTVEKERIRRLPDHSRRGAQRLFPFGGCRLGERTRSEGGLHRSFRGRLFRLSGLSTEVHPLPAAHNPLGARLADSDCHAVHAYDEGR